MMFVVGGCLWVASAVLVERSVSSASVASHTPVMGPSVLNARQLAIWYSRHSGVVPRIPRFDGHPAGDVQALAQVFIDEGNVEGVRGDIAFVQSMVETGWLGFEGSQVPADAFNYAGIYAFDGRPYVGAPGAETCAHGDSLPSRCMGSAQRGVLMQIQLLRSYADASTAGLHGRLISAPSDRVGAAPLWEDFGGNNCPCGKLIWASANGYGLRIIQLYTQALTESGVATTCEPTAHAIRSTSGTGYWEIASDAEVHAVGRARFDGDPHTLRLAAPVVGAASTSTGRGYWLVGRDGGVFAYGDAQFYGSAGNLHLIKPIDGMTSTNDDRGYWLVAEDGGVFAFGNARFYGSIANKASSVPIVGIESTATGKGYWLFASDGNVYGFGDARLYGRLPNNHVSSPIVAMQRTPTSRGYWLLGTDGRVFPFGDAANYGDIAACHYGAASRLLSTPDANGYWIATHDGTIIAFGDATTLGSAPLANGTPVGLLSADPAEFHYTIHYNNTQYALLIKTAAHFHLAARDVPSAGVTVLARQLRSAAHPTTKPVGTIRDAGSHTIHITYDAATNASTLQPVEHYLATTGNHTLYVGGLVMEYIAALQGLR
jgi:hypothetical protein